METLHKVLCTLNSTACNCIWPGPCQICWVSHPYLSPENAKLDHYSWV